jgi:CMP-N-acetylneuraminic acid synthetase
MTDDQKKAITAHVQHAADGLITVDEAVEKIWKDFTAHLADTAHVAEKSSN